MPIGTILTEPRTTGEYLSGYHALHELDNTAHITNLLTFYMDEHKTQSIMI